MFHIFLLGILASSSLGQECPAKTSNTIYSLFPPVYWPEHLGVYYSYEVKGVSYQEQGREKTTFWTEAKIDAKHQKALVEMWRNNSTKDRDNDVIVSLHDSNKMQMTTVD